MQAFSEHALDLSQIELVIFDLDGTLYPYSEFAEKSFNRGLAKHVKETVLHNDEHMTRAITYLIMRQSYERTKYSLTDMIAAWPERKADLRNALIDYQTQVITPRGFVCQEFREGSREVLKESLVILSNALASGMAIVTHSPYKSMGQTLEHLEIADIFEDKITISSCEINADEFKDKSAVKFMEIADEHGVEYDRVLIFEDSGINLIKAKEAGMKTCLISSDIGAAQAAFGKDVDWHVSGILTALNELTEALPAPQSKIA